MAQPRQLPAVACLAALVLFASSIDCQSTTATATAASSATATASSNGGGAGTAASTASGTAFANTTYTSAGAPGPAPAANTTARCNCTTEYAPVCGQDMQTYGNPCVAKCANVLVASQGKCPVCPLGSGDCQCGNTYNPVCANGLTFASPCDAQCGARNCFTFGVCNYTLNSDTFAATPPGNALPGGVKAAAGTTTLPDAASNKYNYADALHKSLLFYHTQRSGNLTTQRVAWRSDSCFSCKGPSGEDLSGGYYEAGGSYLKLGLPEAFIVTGLAWGKIAFASGYQASGELTGVMDAIKWGADYLIASHKTPGNFVAVLGNSTDDFDYYGPPEEKEKWVPGGWGVSCYTNASNPATEITAEAAAAQAAASIAFAGVGGDANYSATLLAEAKSLYSLAKTVQGSYMNTTDPCLMQHAMLYISPGYVDKLAWAAAWLFYATNDTGYLTDARQFYTTWYAASGPGYSFDTLQRGAGVSLLLYQLDAANRATYAGNSKAFLDQYLTQTITHTNRGLAYPYHWGALRPATFAAFLCFVHSQNLKNLGGDASYSAQLFNYGKYQVDYVLGDSGRSWLIGFGSNYPSYVWHKTSYNAYIDYPTRGQYVWLGLDRGPWTVNKTSVPVIVEAGDLDAVGSFTPQKFIAYGALFGAPLQDDGLVFGRKDYTYAEPTTDGNGGITGSLAALSAYFTNIQPVDDCGLNLGWTHPNATVTAKSRPNIGAGSNCTAPAPAMAAATSG